MAENQQVMETLGYRIEKLPNMKTTPRATFYNKDGIEMVNLPADAYHMARYLARGFTLTPPVKPQEVQTPVEVVQVAVKKHRRKHKKNKEK
jgi:hypothetical protein